MTQRTKIAIIGADPSAFHLFNVIYRVDDRFEVACFLNVEQDATTGPVEASIYPGCFSGSAYPKGIPIDHMNPFLWTLKNNKIEKCVFSSFCLTSGLYFYLTAQCLAAGAPVISPNLEMTRIQPPKPLVSFFADTQFHIPILHRILKFYTEDLKCRPAVAFFTPRSLLDLAAQHESPVLPVDKLLADIRTHLGSHDRRLLESIAEKRIPCFYTADLDFFSAQAMRDDSFDMIVFVGFNSLPGYYSSHKTLYACDDFTFGDDITTHPSYSLCRQADAIIMATLKGREEPERLRRLVSEATPVQEIPISFRAQNHSCYPARKCLLLDDGNPTSRCNAAHSISKYLAEVGHMVPIDPPQGPEPMTVAQSSIYCDPVERRWPALIVPDKDHEVTLLLEKTVIPLSGYDVIVSSAAIPKELSTKQGMKPLMQFTFELGKEVGPWEPVLGLPSAAFVRQKRR
jgi:hypothetical protein